MPKQRFERHEPTHDWHQLRSLLKDSAQITYEIIHPVILGWETSKERSAETDMPQRTIHYKANLFDQAGMASLLPPEPQPNEKTLRAIQEAKRLQISPELGEYRMNAALEQLGNKLSPRTCG